MLASCHAVSRGANGLLGDSLERAQLQFAGVDRPDKVRVLKRYGFSSELRRMTCVCTQGASTTVVCKGAPEALRPLLRDVPADYDALYEQHASRGMRVLALASRTVQVKIGRAWTVVRPMRI